MPVDLLLHLSISQTGVQNIHFLYMTQASVSEICKTDFLDQENVLHLDFIASA